MTTITPGTLLRAKRKLAFSPKKIPAGEVFMFVETIRTETLPHDRNAFHKRIFVHWFLNKNGTKVYFIDNSACIETFIETNEKFIEKVEL